MERVTGIGGIFFKAKDGDALKAWYIEHLGLTPDEHGYIVLEWQEPFRGSVRRGSTIWSTFSADTTYFAPSEAPFMINYRVADLDALIAKLREEGIEVTTSEDESYGKFAWVMDPEGNRAELWEPTADDLKLPGGAAESLPALVEHKVLAGMTFRDVDLSRAAFDDINLSGADFKNINLSGARFTDINFKDAAITDASIEGLTINGFNVQALIDAEEARRRA